jgi:hypothetical protein
VENVPQPESEAHQSTLKRSIHSGKVIVRHLENQMEMKGQTGNFIGVLLLLLVVGCKREDSFVDRLTQFNFETDYVVRVPASPISAVPLTVVTPEIKTYSDVAFSSNKTRADLVERIHLKELVLTVKTPTNGTLTFLKSVDIFAIAEGLPEVRVAYKDLVPANIQGTLSLDVTNAELKEYFKREKYSLRIVVTSDEAVMEDYAVNAHGVFFVDAMVLGQ